MTNDEVKNLFVGVMPEDFQEYLKHYDSNLEEFVETMLLVTNHLLCHDKEWRDDCLKLIDTFDNLKDGPKLPKVALLDVNGRPLVKASKA